MKNKSFLLISLVLVLGLVGVLAYLDRSKKEESSVYRVPQQYLVRADGPSHGPTSAAVTIVEFFDPECEACRDMHPIMKKLISEYPHQIRIVYRYATFHTNSIYASSLLEEARAQGKFDQALDLLFENQPVWGSHASPRPDLLPGYLATIGLTKEQMNEESVINKHKALLDQDQADGAALAVSKTPSYFVNGRPLFSIGYEALKTAIDSELQAQTK